MCSQRYRLYRHLMILKLDKGNMKIEYSPTPHDEMFKLCFLYYKYNTLSCFSHCEIKFSPDEMFFNCKILDMFKVGLSIQNNFFFSYKNHLSILFFTIEKNFEVTYFFDLKYIFHPHLWLRSI